MTEQIYRDVFGDEIILTETVRSTILQKHPEVSDFIDQLDVVLAEPDEVRHSKRDDRSILYYRYEAIILNGKWVVVVVKQIDRNFISTIYATDQIKSGEVIWKKTS
ncbi:MAG: hypothetical protein J0M33_06495 [Anaerolineae bacterium]|nr:hypothetical protein [Anaerolineae bacterium]